MAASAQGPQGACEEADRCAGRRDATAVNKRRRPYRPGWRPAANELATGTGRQGPPTRAPGRISTQRRVAGRCRAGMACACTRRPCEPVSVPGRLVSGGVGEIAPPVARRGSSPRGDASPPQDGYMGVVVLIELLERWVREGDRAAGDRRAAAADAALGNRRRTVLRRSRIRTLRLPHGAPSSGRRRRTARVGGGPRRDRRGRRTGEMKTAANAQGPVVRACALAAVMHAAGTPAGTVPRRAQGGEARPGGNTKPGSPGDWTPGARGEPTRGPARLGCAAAARRGSLERWAVLRTAASDRDNAGGREGRRRREPASEDAGRSASRRDANRVSVPPVTVRWRHRR